MTEVTDFERTVAFPAWCFCDPGPMLFLMPKSPWEVHRAGGSLRAPALVPSKSSWWPTSRTVLFKVEKPGKCMRAITFVFLLPSFPAGAEGSCSTRHLYLDQWNRLLTDGLLGLSVLLALQFWSSWTAVTTDFFSPPLIWFKDQRKVHHNLLSLLAIMSVYLHLTVLPFLVSLTKLLPDVKSPGF